MRIAGDIHISRRHPRISEWLTDDECSADEPGTAGACVPQLWGFRICGAGGMAGGWLAAPEADAGEFIYGVFREPAGNAGVGCAAARLSCDPWWGVRDRKIQD